MTKEELQTIKDRLAIAATANSPVRAVVAYDIVYVCDDIAVLIAEVERLQGIVNTFTRRYSSHRLIADAILDGKGKITFPQEERPFDPGKTW